MLHADVAEKSAALRRIEYVVDSIYADHLTFVWVVSSILLCATVFVAMQFHGILCPLIWALGLGVIAVAVVVLSICLDRVVDGDRKHLDLLLSDYSQPCNAAAFGDLQRQASSFRELDEGALRKWIEREKAAIRALQIDDPEWAFAKHTALDERHPY